MKFLTLAAALIASASTSWAQNLATQCYSDVCYQINIPEQTASSWTGDIYFQLSGPASKYSWIGLGQGKQMAGSNIFMIYADGNGNVTLSPRRGVGNVEPIYDASTNATLLEGSGISNGMMYANVRCSDCQEWQGGSADFSEDSGSWIRAALSGEPLDSTDPDEGLQMHNEYGAFTWNYAPAKGGMSVNPFVTQNGEVIAPSMSGGGVSSSSSSSSGPSPATVTAILAHGGLAAVTFLVLFPVGAILIRIPGLNVWIHGGFQIFSYCCFIAAAGLGIYIALTLDLLNSYHPIIGLVLFGVLFFQPFTGVVHHKIYKKKQSRTAVSYVHVWIGRLAIILGMINGGLGILLSGQVKQRYIIAYGVVAGVMGLIFLLTIVYGEVKATKSKPSSLEESKEENGRH